jgi:hypothetical protein
MQDKTPKRRVQKLREEHSRKLRELIVQLGESLLQSRGVALSSTKVERERIAQIAAYKDLIRSKTGELDDWTQHGRRATNQGMAREAEFRQEMIKGMEGQLRQYREELRRLQPTSGSFWADST